MIHDYNPDSLFTIAFYLLLDPTESIQLFRMIAATELIPWATTVLAVGYAVYLSFKTASNDSAKRINATIDLDNTKVVHNFDIEDLEPKTVFCRCWKSKKFPYCDGSHNKHNETTGDNVGPLIIQKK